MPGAITSMSSAAQGAASLSIGNALGGFTKQRWISTQRVAHQLPF
ncbi:hypothetical protein [uncultured Devosia sp.]|nr:hypothetical protein [uncultured Devosia sp.]